MNIRNSDARKMGICVILFIGFLMSQNVTWEIIDFSNYSGYWDDKLPYILQIEGVCIYTLFAVYYTADRQWVERIVEKVPIIKTIFTMLVSVLTYIFVYTIRFIFALVALFDTKNVNREVESSKVEAKQELEKYKNGPFVVKTLAGIGGLTIVVFVVSAICELKVVQCISNVGNLLLNTMIFFIVCANVKVSMTTKKSKNPKKHNKCMRIYKRAVIVLVAIILWILIPPFINLMIKTEPVFFADFFGYVDSENSAAWISFYGAIIGGVITLVGVAWTIIEQNKKREEDIKDSVKPILVASACTFEKIKQSGKERVFECILEYKNVGKGILYNPRVFNIEYSVDKKEIGELHPSFSVKNYIDINSTADNDIMILFKPEILNEIYESLKGRGNTIPLQIVMYVGGKDMYGRDIITQLEYKSSLIFFSVEDIQLPIHSGQLTSRVLFDEEEISKVIDNTNWRYNVHY